MAPSMPKVFSNIDTGKVTNNELLDATQPSAFEFLGLSKKQRLYAFGGCLIGGFVVSILGAVMFVFGNVVSFALLYVVGICISLAGTGFLIGFKRQIKTMFKPVRLIATILFLASILMVFISAFVLKIDILVIVFAIITFLTYTWYSLSYIPYARSLVTKAVSSAV
ncbi:Got1/Sft2-like family-domain-containing protein [Phakopsora pachyrhizi]|uniref:Protein transport protein SFT2 n=1 Tax=Phakopsora pachyrhizi TaxID=170000 RepID=A0AAV0B2Z4_PHAPC|nr:Got1/Sft2-like family-domain-containing protein [Phakopsora pachyrhizi]CAH7680116.1 Got1/Sft2-like family-domain-containing protein [Phakopsora pachyrhizi]CAH7683006.1 Got1/Sft2-like family-domain-containing protein [Phakopsora pachyrhizi]